MELVVVIIVIVVVVVIGRGFKALEGAPKSHKEPQGASVQESHRSRRPERSAQKGAPYNGPSIMALIWPLYNGPSIMAL